MPHPSLEELSAEVDAALAAGSPAAALVALRPHVRRLAAVEGDRLRALVARLPADAWGTDAGIAAAMAASYRSAGSPRGASGLGYLVAAEALLDHRGPEATTDRVTVWLAHAAALRGLGALDEALEYVRRAEDAASHAALPVSTRVELDARSALEHGMLHLLLGELDAGRERLEFAEGLAPQALIPAERLEVLGGLALTHYVQTGLGEVDARVAAARALAAGTTLWRSRFAAPVLAAGMLTAVERGDHASAERLEAELRPAAAGSEWEPFAALAEGSRRLAAGALAEALDQLAVGRRLYRTWQPPGLGLPSVELIRATALIALDQGDEAWEILQKLIPFERHLLCPGRIVALLRFRSGDLNGALAALVDCEALGDDHNVRTMVEVRMLRAAIDYVRGEFDASDVAFDRGLAAMTRTGSRAPLRLIPPGILSGLASRALERAHTDAPRGVLREIVQATEGRDDDLEPLSPRELRVLAEVEKGSTVAGIAAALYVSPNTVKTHLRRLYRKLGVATRADAIRKAKALGLGAAVTRESPE